MKNFEAVNKILEAKMLTYSQLSLVPANDNEEQMVPLIQSAGLSVRPIDKSMLVYTGEQIYVRETVRYKLGNIATQLEENNTGCRLQVVYGYRPLSVQRANHEKRKLAYAGRLSGLELIEVAHRYVAEPTVAGHPTGGAVDVRLLRDEVSLDFGTQLREFIPQTYVDSPYISKIARTNRDLLREYMMTAGFAPFDGEWWHFSYGDREWAKYYDKPAAIYEQLELETGQRRALSWNRCTK